MNSIKDKIFSELENMSKICHKKYSIQFKLKVIDFYKLNVSIHPLSNKL